MTLLKTNKKSYHAILIATIYVTILHSSTPMAATSVAAVPQSESLLLPRFRELQTARDEILLALPMGPVEDRTIAHIFFPALIGSILTVTPPIALGHEAFYQRLMASKLEYRPTPGSDEGLITLPFWDLLAPLAGTENPLSGTFDLSRCGDAGQYFSINIGYKKAKIPANVSKYEVWICPWFLAEGEKPASLGPLMGQWESPVGYLWTWGGWDPQTDNYDYFLQPMDNNKNLYEKWGAATHSHAAPTSPSCPPHGPRTMIAGGIAYTLAMRASTARSKMQNFSVQVSR
jgi:hypothetical protein